jgi:hypothetical protein
MRVLTAPQTATFNAAIQSTAHATHVRVRLDTTGAGVFSDMSSYLGRDWLESVEWGDGIDTPCSTAAINFRRSEFGKSLSALIQMSEANQQPLGTYVPALTVGRKVFIDAATLADGVEPLSADWVTVFAGRVDEIDEGGSAAFIKCSLRDLGGDLLDTYIETQRAYGSTGAGTPVEFVAQAILDDNNPAQSTIAQSLTWNGTTTVTTANTAGIVVGDFIGLNGSPFYQVSALVVNTSFTILNPYNPTIPTGSGAGVSRLIQAAARVSLYSVNGISTYPFNAGDSPGFNILPYIQQKESILEAIRKLTQQFGWDARYKFGVSAGSYQLTMYSPDRAKVTPDFTWQPSDRLDASSVKITRQNIRNAVRIVYTDRTTPATPVRSSVTLTDAPSITKYGRRFMEIAEDGSSQIDTAGEATTMATAALSDLKEPNVDKTATTPLFLVCELGDLYRFVADGELFDADQDLAVISYKHSVSASGGQMTNFMLRGKPAGGFMRWLRMESRSGVAPTSDFNAPAVAAGSSLQPGIGAVIIVYDDPVTYSPPVLDWSISECHIDGPYDTAPGGTFSPTSATLKQKARTTRFEIHNLVPGKFYRAIVLVIDDKGNKSTAVSAIVQATEMVGPYHTNPASEFGTINPNADFNISTKGAAAGPPDFWLASITGPLAAGWSNAPNQFYESADSQQGDKSVIFNKPTVALVSDRTAVFESGFIPCTPDQLFRIDCTFKRGAGSGASGVGFAFGIGFYTQALAGALGAPLADLLYPANYSLSSGTGFNSFPANVWQQDRGWANTFGNTTVRFMKVFWQVYNDNFGGTNYLDAYVDRLRVSKSLIECQHDGNGGTARSSAASTWTKPYFSGSANTDNAGLGTFTPGNSIGPVEHKYTVPKTAYYTIFGQVQWATAGFSNNRRLAARFLKNAAVFATSETVYHENVAINAPRATVHSGVVLLTKGDTIQLEGFQNDAARNFDMSTGATKFRIQEVAVSDQ